MHNNTLPKINMVFHGEHSSWVFGKMLNLYQEAARGRYNIIPSIDPRPGCDVYQYWRPVSPQALKTMPQYAPNSEYYTKGIQMMHDSPYDNLRHKTAIRLKTLDNHKYIMCTSQEQMDFYSDKISKENLKYLPLGVFKEQCVWHDPRIKGKLRIGFIARYYSDRVKGEDLVFQIAQRLDKSKFEFVIRCPNNGVLASRLKRLRFNVSSSGDYDVLLVCSKFEGTPLPLLEAMASGIYVLSTRVGESPVLLESDQLCDNNHNSFISKLNELEQNRSTLVNAMPVLKDKVKDRTWKRFINDSMALWDDIIGNTFSEPIIVNEPIEQIKQEEAPVNLIEETLSENSPDASYSLFISAFNAQHYIRDCLDSIMKARNEFQKYKGSKLEILIGVDGCVKTMNAIEKVASNYKHIPFRVFYTDTNCGTYITANTLIQQCQFTNYIRFDADDIMLPNALTMVHEMRNRNHDNHYIQLRYKTFIDGSNPMSSELRRRNLATGVAQGVICFDKTVLDALGGFRDWRCSCDIDFNNRWFRFSGKRPVATDNIAFYYRRHGNSLTTSGLTRSGGKYRTDVNKIALSKNSKEPTYIAPVIGKYKQII